jgi:pSer/pThr/pTyr-binding forkhead associated (FHA) protein
LQIWDGTTQQVVELKDTARVAIGRDAGNHVVIDDATSSSLHAVLERVGAAWTVRDVASRNGTFVNGERLWGERALRPGDEIRIGLYRLLFRSDARSRATEVETSDRPPRLTNRERDVLVALCRPVLAGNLFTDPATVREIAAELVVSDTAVKQHLANLFDKFQVAGERRRVELANRAVRSGAVSLADLFE